MRNGPLDKQDLTVNGFSVFTEKLGDNAYWLRNENIVIIFNPGALGEEPVVIGEIREKMQSEHYKVDDIVKALAELRK